VGANEGYFDGTLVGFSVGESVLRGWVAGYLVEALVGAHVTLVGFSVGESVLRGWVAGYLVGALVGAHVSVGESVGESANDNPVEFSKNISFS